MTWPRRFMSVWIVGTLGFVVAKTAIAIVQTRLQALPTSARKLLRLASVFGEAFSQKALVDMSLTDGAETIDTNNDLEKLREEELLLSPSDNTDATGRLAQWTFRHSLIRQASYEMLTEGDRLAAHHAAAEWLVQQDPQVATEIAAQYEQANALPQQVLALLK